MVASLHRSAKLLATLALAVTALPVHSEALPAEIAAKPETARLTPTAPWNIDFGDSKCRLQRFFDYQGQRHVLLIEQSVPGASFGLIAAGPAVARLNGVRDVAVGMLADQPLKVERGIISGTLAEYGPALFTTRLKLVPDTVSTGASKARAKGKTDTDGLKFFSAGVDLEQAARVSRVVLADDKGNRAVSFETGNLKGAIAALDTCTSDLLAEWGLDPEKHRQYQPPRFLNALQVAKSVQRNYPQNAAEKGESGIFTLRLIVEANGTISDCHFEASTKVAELEPQCRLVLSIAKMAPGLDAQGQPMKSFFVTQVTYKLED